VNEDISAEDLYDALDRVINPPPYDGPSCHCGSISFIQRPVTGFHCHNGHRLPGQDMPK
jgi:hypothetical protein